MENKVCKIIKNDKAWKFLYKPMGVWMTLTRVDDYLETDYKEEDDYVSDWLIAWGNDKKYMSRYIRLEVSLPDYNWETYPHSDVVMEYIMADEVRFKNLVDAALLEMNSLDGVAIPNANTGKTKNFHYTVTIL